MTMSCAITQLSSLGELRDLIEGTICDRQLLLLGSFEVSEKVLVRHGQPCGIHYTLDGPRSVQYSAIWDLSRQTILFYDSAGERFHRCQLIVTDRLRKELSARCRFHHEYGDVQTPIEGCRPVPAPSALTLQRNHHASRF